MGTGATQHFTLTVDQAPKLTSAASAKFTAGSTGSFLVTAPGYPAPMFSETGALPSGVTLTKATGELRRQASGHNRRPLQGHRHGDKRRGQRRRPIIHPDRRPGSENHQCRLDDVHRRVDGQIPGDGLRLPGARTLRVWGPPLWG